MRFKMKMSRLWKKQCNFPLTFSRHFVKIILLKIEYDRAQKLHRDKAMLLCYGSDIHNPLVKAIVGVFD